MENQNVIGVIENLIGSERCNRISPDYFEVLGTDRYGDTSKLFGPAFYAYRDAWKNNPKNHIVGNFPLHLDVETTNTCNLRCKMCQIPFSEIEKGFMGLGLYEKILAEVKNHSLPSMKFNFRGEPLLHPQIAEFIRRAKVAGVLETQFNSNGSCLNDDLSERLISAGLDRIKFSVDAVTPETYNSIRIGTTYEETIPRILRFIEIRNSLRRKLPVIHVQMVYMESNRAEVQKYIKFWEDKVNRIGFSRYRGSHNRLGERGRVERLKERYPCHQLWQRLLVLLDGTVLMCCGDHLAKNPLGNVNNQSLAEIWNGKKLNQIRQLHINHQYDEVEACVGCEVNYL